MTLILTTMNEVEGIKAIWSNIPFYAFKQTIIVDNHSDDGTLEYIQATQEYGDSPYSIKIIQQTTPGRGNAIQETMRDVNDDVVMLMSSDGNDDPKFIPALLTEFALGHDLVIASRFLPFAGTDDSDDPYHLRRFGNQLLTYLVNLSFGSHYTDPTSGFRIFKTTTWIQLHMNPTKNDTEYLMSVRAAKKKLRTSEVPMIEGKRVGGEVKAKTWSTGLHLLHILIRELMAN